MNAVTTAQTTEGQAQPTIDIAGRRVGRGHPAYLIAEVAQAHDGSLGLAHKFIDAAADAGADAVKFQTHFANEESTLDEPFRVKFSNQDDTRYAYWTRMEFTDEQWAGLAQHARVRKLDFLSSAFSVRAFELLDRLGVPAWKIASGEINSHDLLGHIAATGRPVLLSTGMSTYDEIANTVAEFRKTGGSIAILQCTSHYPTPLKEVGLNVISELEKRFQCPVGLSDHSGVIYPAIFAIARGAAIIEAHITLDRRMFGPDVVASLTVEEFSVVSQAKNALQEMETNPVNKDAMADALKDMRQLFQKSVSVVRPLPEGTVLTQDMLTIKKPATGIPANKMGEVIGRRLARAVEPDRILTWNDLS